MEACEVDSTITIAITIAIPISWLSCVAQHVTSALQTNGEHTPAQSRRSRQKAWQTPTAQGSSIQCPNTHKHTRPYLSLGRAVPSPTPCSSTMTSIASACSSQNVPQLSDALSVCGIAPVSPLRPDKDLAKKINGNLLVGGAVRQKIWGSRAFIKIPPPPLPSFERVILLTVVLQFREKHPSQSDNVLLTLDRDPTYPYLSSLTRVNAAPSRLRKPNLTRPYVQLLL
jgi:hypothetical protein